MKQLSFEEKLRIQFRKALRRSYCDNAVLDPPSSNNPVSYLDDGESIVVRVDGRDGTKYWFTPYRVISQRGTEVEEVLQYAQIHTVGWMFKNREEMITAMASSNWGQTKQQNLDRLEVETSNGMEIVFPELGQAYVPTLTFFEWCVRCRVISGIPRQRFGMIDG